MRWWWQCTKHFPIWILHLADVIFIFWKVLDTPLMKIVEVTFFCHYQINASSITFKLDPNGMMDDIKTPQSALVWWERSMGLKNMLFRRETPLVRLDQLVGARDLRTLRWLSSLSFLLELQPWVRDRPLAKPLVIGSQINFDITRISRPSHAQNPEFAASWV